MQETSGRSDVGVGIFGLGDVVKVIVMLVALVGAFAALSGPYGLKNTSVAKKLKPHADNHG